MRGDDCSPETQGVLVSIEELTLGTARACTKRLDETKWSETRDETPRR